jgi:hypothetical protein
MRAIELILESLIVTYSGQHFDTKKVDFENVPADLSLKLAGTYINF